MGRFPFLLVDPMIPAVRMGGLSPAWYRADSADEPDGYIVSIEEAASIEEATRLREVLEAIAIAPICGDPMHRHSGPCDLYSTGTARRLRKLAVDGLAKP